MAAQEKPDEDKYVGKKVKHKSRARGGAEARWPACKICGNEVGNTTYMERGEQPKGATGPPAMHTMMECAGCGDRSRIDGGG